MAITRGDIVARHVDNSGASRTYWLHGANVSTTEQEVVDWIGANAPSEIAGFPFADFDARDVEDIPGDYEVEISWGNPQLGGPGQGISTLEYAFAFQAPAGHIYQSLSTVASYTDPALGYAVDPNVFGGAINVVNDGGKYRVEGLNLSPPNEVFKLSYRAPNATISSTFQRTVRSMCGKVNSLTFQGEPAGSLMLVRVSGGRDTSGIWFLEFGFGNIQNDTNIQVGNITVTQKDGFDLLWIFYGKKLQATANGRLPSPQYVFIERIFKRDDFNILNLPAL